MLVNKSLLIRMRKGEEFKTPRHASAAATRNGNLPSRDGNLPYSRQIIIKEIPIVSIKL
jgi:hypothetical protein